MPRVITKTVYLFEELNEMAKRNVRREWLKWHCDLSQEELDALIIKSGYEYDVFGILNRG